MKQRYEAPK